MSIIQGNVHVNGALSASQTVPSNGSVTDGAVASNANIDADKLEHRHVRSIQQERDTTAATREDFVHCALANGTLRVFRAAAHTVAVGAATVVFDLLKNGATVLSAPITLNSSSAANDPAEATIASASYTAGDVFVLTVTATAGGGTLPTGPWAQAVFDEQAA